MNDQIEEMAKVIFESSPIPLVWRSDAVKFAKALYNAGYRKASDVAREVAEQFKKTAKQYLLEKGLYLAVFKNALNHAEAELTKKYESEGADED